MSYPVSSQTNLPRHLVCLDLIKGLGILGFIYWHVFESLYACPPEMTAVCRTLFSVTGLFVFSSGFLIGCHYYGKLQLSKESDPLSIFWRLCIRAGKLAIIVLMANIAMSFLKTREFSLGNLLSVLENIASLFYVDRWDISLQVLMSIAVTLLTGYLLLLLIHRLPHALYIFLFLLALLAVADLFVDDNIPYLWRYVLHGMFGVPVGMFFFKNILSGKLSKRIVKISGLVFLGIFLTIVGIVAIMVSAYYFFVYNLGPDLLAVSACFIGFCSIFYLLYDLGKRPLGWAGNIIKHLGKQSLFVYLVQIMVINLIALILTDHQLHAQWEGYVLSVLVLLVCLISCRLMDYARRYNFAERLYRMVFQ